MLMKRRAAESGFFLKKALGLFSGLIHRENRCSMQRILQNGNRRQRRFCRVSRSKRTLEGVPGGGTSIYDHLTQVLAKIIEERPADANALFEEISASIRDATIAEGKRLPTDTQLV